MNYERAPPIASLIFGGWRWSTYDSRPWAFRLFTQVPTLALMQLQPSHTQTTGEESCKRCPEPVLFKRLASAYFTTRLAHCDARYHA